jgi:Fe-Mn family superoxide dismutase
MYTPKDYKNLLGIKGFSDLSLNTHFTLYEGYVKNINSILDKLRSEGLDKTSIEAAEMRRRLSWEYNGMKLHEIYFESISQAPNPIDLNSRLITKINEAYGDFSKFLGILKSTGMARGIGWVAVLKEDKTDDIFTVWFEEHDTGIFANSKVLLCIDMLEHAFILDYGTKKADYIDSFLESVDWKIVEDRFAK